MVNALIVGAGAVGQVYGHFLQRGGAAVSYLVKEKYQAQCEQGFTLYRCRRNGLGAPERFQATGIYTDLEAVRQQHWDEVWLAISSADLRGDFLPRLRDAIGDATLVMLQPDLDDRDYVCQVFPAQQVVCGVVNFIAYQTPLPGLPDYQQDASKQGVAYLLLPLMPAEFAGSESRLPEVAAALAEGRFNVKVQQDASRIYADRSAMMIPLVALLELEHWSFRRLRHSRSLELAVNAAREALTIVAARFGQRLNWTERLFNLFSVKLALPLMRILSPMDAEAYLKFQFRKTAPQTRLMLQHFIDDGERLGQPVHSLKTLQGLLQQSSQDQAA